MGRQRTFEQEIDQTNKQCSGMRRCHDKLYDPDDTYCKQCFEDAMEAFDEADRKIFEQT